MRLILTALFSLLLFIIWLLLSYYEQIRQVQISIEPDYLEFRSIIFTVAEPEIAPAAPS